MKLKSILENLNYINIKGDLNIDIENIQYDSRKVNEKSLFICVKGFNVDGHSYISDCIDKGCRAFLVEQECEVEGLTFIQVKDNRAAMAKVSSNFFNNPTKKLNVVGVTGTNGKTSITHLIKEILNANNEEVGMIGTIKNIIGNEEIISQRTTPESLELQEYFHKMNEQNINYCTMEVSSHSLELKRVDQCDFKIGVFTNLTPDHLDFHDSLEDYRNAKEKLFYKTSVANIINIDDEGGQHIYENVKDLSTKTYTYAIDNEADFRAENIQITLSGVTFDYKTPTYKSSIKVPIPGRFSVYNALAVIATCYLLKIPKETVIDTLEKTKGVSGRFENISSDLGFNVVVDYAHTPDALENILNTGREFVKGRIITVFGCGGNRDKSKRPLMGQISQNLSDYSIITSDNPRNEKPEDIIEDILSGFKKDLDNYEVVIDRRNAIEKAILMAKKEDLVIIAGKGHEDYQIIGDQKFHFDDKEVAKEIMGGIGYETARY